MAVAAHKMGVGLYGFTEVAALLGRSHQWVIGNLRSLDTVRAHRVPRDQLLSQGLLSFADLIELYLLDFFLDEGLKRGTVIRAVETLSRDYGVARPFTIKKFETDGWDLFAAIISQDYGYEEDLSGGKGQLIDDRLIDIRKTIEVQIEYDPRAGTAVRLWPLADQGSRGRIVLDPKRHFGKPIDAETGIDAQALYEAWVAEGRQHKAAIARWFSVPLSAIEQAIAFYESRQRQAA